MKVLCYNILRGGQFEAGNRLGEIISFIQDQKPTIAALFECDQFEANDFKIAKLFKKELNMKLFLQQARSKSHIALLYHEDLVLERAFTFDRFLYHGLLAADFDCHGEKFRIVAAHLNPYSAELRLIEAQILTQLALRAENSLIVGDFNCPPPYEPLDITQFKKTFQARVSNEKKELDTRSVEHILNNGFEDLWLTHHPDESQGTYPTSLGEKDKEYLHSLRIDYFFGSEYFKEHCKSCSILDHEPLSRVSDHFPIVAEFNIPC